MTVPVAFVRPRPDAALVPVTASPFQLGSGRTADLCEQAPGVTRQHASLRYQKGEYMLSPREGASVWVNGKRVPLMALHDGDTVQLAPGGVQWTFRNHLQGSFHPSGASLAEAWIGHPAYADPANSPQALGEGVAIGGRDLARCRRVGSTVVKGLGPMRSMDDGDRFLRTLAALGGARHPGLARLVDGGLAPIDGAPQRWMATAWVAGTTADEQIEVGELLPWQVLAVLDPLAAALGLLHERGVVHRDVSPGNVVITPRGGGTLIDYGQAVPAGRGVPASRGVVGTPGYVAPEEVLEGGAAVAPAVDVYGLAAVGYALLTGGPPAQGEDVLATLALATARPLRPSALGIEVPEALDTALVQGLSPDAAERPSAAAFGKALAFAASQLGLGGVAS